MPRANNSLELAARLSLVRKELYGEHGLPQLADGLGLPARTWANYEAGVTVPASVILDFILLTGAEPSWLAHGAGPVFRESRRG